MVLNWVIKHMELIVYWIIIIIMLDKMLPANMRINKLIVLVRVLKSQKYNYFWQTYSSVARSGWTTLLDLQGQRWHIRCTFLSQAPITTTTTSVHDTDFVLTTILFKTPMSNASNGSEVKRRRKTVGEWEGERLRGWQGECPQIQ